MKSFSPGLNRVCKAFLIGLSAGGLIRGGFYADQKRASETTNIFRQNENFYLK